MCGIAGIFDPSLRRNAAELKLTALAMAQTLAHRGPDASGLWAHADSGVALAHRRLSILDLTTAGNQPMLSPGGRYVIVYNGEVYNHDELGKELESQSGIGFRGHSDTEVMLAAFERWGIEAAIQRFHGMFAFALWDSRERSLYLVRDRFGEKPLYYAWSQGALLFGSELKALRAAGIEREIDHDALALYFRCNCIPAPYSIYRGVFKLPPASYLRISAHDRSAPPVFYWQLRQVARQGIAQPFAGAEAEACDELEAILNECVRRQLIADVPVGAFLSGGIDSSLITALIMRQGSRVKSFSIGLRDSSYDESANARCVAEHLGSEHTQLVVEPADALKVIPSLARIYDEPFADSSQIPTVLLSQLTRQHVKVALSGDGGDEVFAGYNRYIWVPRVWKAVGWLPRPARLALGRAATALPARSWNALFAACGPLLPRALRHRLPGDKLHKLAPLLGAEGLWQLYAGVAAHWQNCAPLAHPPPAATNHTGVGEYAGSLVEGMMYLDTTNYLPSDILAKVDRAGMAVGLELRSPFLDHGLAEFAWRLPMSLKIRNRQGKYILRRLLARHVPAELWQRPKMGFGIPLDSWLRGPLREWAEELLSPARLRREGYLDPLPISERWQEHCSGRRDWQYHLWDVLMFQAWLQSENEVAPAQTARAESAAHP